MNALLQKAVGSLVALALESENIVGEVGYYYSVNFTRINGCNYFELIRVLRVGGEFETESIMDAYLSNVSIENIDIAIAKIKGYSK